MYCFINLKPSIKQMNPDRSTYRWDRDTRSLKEPSGTLEISFPWSVLEEGRSRKVSNQYFICSLQVKELVLKKDI